MRVFSECYLEEVVENQGKLFDYVAHSFPTKDTCDFIKAYMKSKTRKYVDEGQAYVCTMNFVELLDYFCVNEGYVPKDGKSLKGFLPDWIGEFYAYYQWYYEISSAEAIEKVPLNFLLVAYGGLHDLDLELAVRKVGEQLCAS